MVIQTKLRYPGEPLDELITGGTIIKSRDKWIEYSKAAKAMFEMTDIPEAPWFIVNADIKKHARLNCINHLLKQIPYEDVILKKIDLPPRREDYSTPEYSDLNIVPENY